MLIMLENPSIIRPISYFYDHERYYLMMDYCKGGDLLKACNNKRLGRDKNGLTKFTEKQISVIMKDLFSALATTHHNRIIHRDIKLDNICFK